MTELTCHGCGLPLVKAWTGREPKWCSERCRKAQYSRGCADCGASMTGCNGRGPNAPVRCHKCSDSIQGERQGRHMVEVWTPRRQAFAERYNAGATYKELAEEFGISVNGVSRYLFGLREHGFELPYRRPEAVREAIRRGLELTR